MRQTFATHHARRPKARSMMNPERPVLRKFMGNNTAYGPRYLSVEEVQALVRDRRWPGKDAER